MVCHILAFFCLLPTVFCARSDESNSFVTSEEPQSPPHADMRQKTQGSHSSNLSTLKTAFLEQRSRYIRRSLFIHKSVLSLARDFFASLTKNDSHIFFLPSCPYTAQHPHKRRPSSASFLPHQPGKIPLAQRYTNSYTQSPTLKKKPWSKLAVATTRAIPLPAPNPAERRSPNRPAKKAQRQLSLPPKRPARRRPLSRTPLLKSPRIPKPKSRSSCPPLAARA